MTRFRYKAVAASGEVLEGEMEAATRMSVIDRLRGDGHMPVRAEELGSATAGLSSLARLLEWRRSSRIDIGLLTRELATLLRAGLSLDRALAVLGNIAGRKLDREFIARLLAGIRSGTSLAAALEPYRRSLPSFYIGMIRAGEAGGGLDLILTRLADAMEKAKALKETVRSAMYYPIFVLVTIGLSLLVLLTVVVPEFRPLFEDSGAAVPLSMALVIGLGDAIRGYWWLILAAVLAALVGARQAYERPAVRLWSDRQLLRSPIFGGLSLKIEVARFTRTLGTLLTSGVPLLNALAISGETIGNRVVAKAMTELATKLRKGEGLSAPLMQAGLFPPLAVQLVQVGEESGQLESMLLRIADIYDEEVKQTVQRLMALLVPAITVALGLIVGAVVATMLSAILGSYDLPI